jgi:hypothetical protein
MRRRRVQIAMLAVLAASSGAALVDGCATSGTGGIGSGGSITTASTGTGGAIATGSTGGGIVNLQPDAGDASDGSEGGLDPCGSKCGPTELCDPAHLGLDDNCNGAVDEGCSCNPGQVHWCFRGDPAYHHAPGCYDGTETCNELGLWGECIGGVGATPPDNCYMNDTSVCHAITTAPFASIHLKTGTGSFSANAIPGSETYSVECPAGVSQCPAVTSPDDFEPLQSGEYEIVYSKSVAGDPNPISCTFPLFVGAPGLRVELSWEHTTADMGVDLDLHMHQPVDTGPWGTNLSVGQDCGFVNCTIGTFAPDAGAPFGTPHWFPDTNTTPQPVNWDNAASVADNTCYNDPRQQGILWQQLGMGCHNPRLDVDNRQCDYSITDPTNDNFCTPENINVDYPPTNQWIRIGVHYYYNHGLTYDVHPEIKVFCDGALSGDLGPTGYYLPTSPVTFAAADGANNGNGNRFWIVADVLFLADNCGNLNCAVKPIYADDANLTPLLTIDTAATTTFAPPWPPVP